MATLGFSWAAVAWNLVFYVGAAALARALAPKPKPIEGPRLDDLKLTNSAYGAHIAHGYGVTRVGGNMIWGLPIREQKHTERVGGKGGGPSQKIITWSYWFTGAIAVGEGEIDDILRIWADSKLIFDRGGNQQATERERRRLEGLDEFNEAFYNALITGGEYTGTRRAGWNFRLYKGTEDQLPDPAIEADIGVGNTVPHRGIAYVVFDDCPLADFGNRVPIFSFEVAWKANPVQPIIVPTFLPDSMLNSVGSDHLAIAWEAGIYFTSDESGDDGETWFAVMDIGTNTQLVEFVHGVAMGFGPEFEELVGPTTIGTGPSGHLYGASYLPGGSSVLWKADPLTATNVWTNPISNFGLHPIQIMEVATQPTAVSPGTYFLVTAPFFVTGHFSIWHAGIGGTGGMDGTFLGSFQGNAEGISDGANRIARGYSDTNYCEVWGLSVPFFTSGDHDDEPLHLYRARLDRDAWGLMFGQSPGIDIDGSSVVMEFLIYPHDLASWFGSPSPVRFAAGTGAIVFDKTGRYVGSPLERNTGDPMIFVTVALAGAGAAGAQRAFLLKIDSDNGDILWVIPDVEVPANDFQIGQSRIDGGVFAYATTIDTVTFIDTIGGTIIQEEDWSAAKSAYGVAGWADGEMVYDSQREAIITFGGSGTSPHIILLNRKSGDGVYLWEIVQDLCLRGGYEASDLDVSQLLDIVQGFHVSEITSARGAIEPLAIAYQFDGVESDFKIKFPKRGGASVVTIPQDDLAVVNEDTGAVLIEQRIPDNELPLRITVRYYDKDRDYEHGAQYAARRISPLRSTEADLHLSHDVPVVFYAQEVKQRAEWLLYEAWIGRTSLQIKSSWEYLKYDPLDVVTVALNDGTTFLARIVQADLGADWSIEYRMVTEDAAIYSDSAVLEAESGLGGGYDPSVYVPNLQASRVLLIDAPLLQDSDDNGRISSTLYVSAAPGLGIGVWPGATVYQSSDGSVWQPSASVPFAPKWGTAAGALAAPESAWLTDVANSLIVDMANGATQLETITDLALLNGGNPALLINSASGEVELIQYRDVEVIGATRLRLSHLLRGRRGTDTMMGNHAQGDTFIVPEALTVSTISQPLSALSTDRYFRSITVGTLIEAGVSTPLEVHGRDLMPYAPSQQEVEISGSNLLLSWQRRSRITGEWLDSTEEPLLAEDSELYSVDIYSGFTIIRTVSVGGSRSFIYTAAQIAADFGSIPATLKWCVYQISGQVGRGFGEVVTVDVPGRA